MPRRTGFVHSPETRAAISAGIRKALAEGRGSKLGKRYRTSYQPPAEFRRMYVEFVHLYGAKEARRLVEDHAAIVARRLSKPT